MPPDVSIARNVATAKKRWDYTKLGATLSTATTATTLPILGPIGVGLNIAAVTALATNHANWFYKQVDNGGDWDYKAGTTETDSKTQKSIYEPFGNFHFGIVGAAAGFDRGNTLQRMAGLKQEQNQQPGGGGEHGGLSSIIDDFIHNRAGGTAPYRDEWADQVLIERGRAYYYAGCYNKK